MSRRHELAADQLGRYDAGVPDPAPLDALPGWLRSMVETVASATQTDPAMGFTLALPVLATAMQASVEVVTEGARVVPLPVWAIVVLDSGEAKSPVFAHLTRPVQKLQRALERTTRSRPASGGGKLSAFAASFSAVRRAEECEPGDRDARGGGSPDRGRASSSAEHDADDFDAAAEDEADHEAEDQEDPDEPQLPEGLLDHLGRCTRESELVISDATHPALVQLLARQRLGVGMFSPDSGMLDGFMSHVAIGDLNKAFDGESIRPRRISRAARPVDRAVVTIGTSLQPAPFQTLFRNRLAFESGFLNRFLVCFPEARSGQRRAPFSPPNPDVVRSYDDAVLQLFALAPLSGRRRLRLTATPGAERAAARFFNSTEAQIAGEYRPIRGWLDKLRLYQWRIAALLHVADQMPCRAAAVNPRVSADAMERAETICRYFIAHALTAFGVSAREAAAAEILRTVEARPEFMRLGFTRRELLRVTRRSAEEVAPALEKLVEDGVLEVEVVGKATKYRIVSGGSGEPEAAVESSRRSVVRRRPGGRGE